MNYAAMHAEDSAMLFLVVDAVPFEMAREAWEEGWLEGFERPRPMVSVFPSLTHVAVSALMSGVFEPLPMGYEARYFDPKTGEVQGGFSDPASEETFEPLHGHARGVLGHVAVYLLRRPLAYAQVHWITRHFVAQGGPWLAYVPATDGVGHFGGRSGLRSAFRDVCEAVAEARREFADRNGTVPRVVMCSDHGMAFGRLEHLSATDLAGRLERAGFATGVGRRVSVNGGEPTAVLVPYGAVGGGAVYCDPARAPEVAGLVAAAPGVDVAFGRYGEGCLAVAYRDHEPCRAHIAWCEDRYRYEPIDGDPLGYWPVWQQLERAGRLRAGWADDADVFAATWNHPYPDALSRVRHGLQDVVRLPAPVLFSMKESWTWGPPLTHLGAQLLGGQIGTHGALTAAESTGFAICTSGAEPPSWRSSVALRPRQVFRPWADLVRAGSAVHPPAAAHPTA